ncbi:uncharacterized protein [Drosophila bipectinata]|uniref:uncharacterized protein isoform X1 n=2 Tax=Drosophila bipectinata TaxID=42026 RepID=UPI0007E79E83|nr:pupal cuticle protein Edg-91 [Drosophila bipectinata]
MSSSNWYLGGSLLICLIIAKFSAVVGQAGTVHWNNGNTAGVGAWSNAQSGGMQPPGSLGSHDPQYSYGYAGIDSRGSYGGAGGNGAYYVGGTDEHGRPFSYGGQGQQGYMGVRDPNYPGGVYGYRNTATGMGGTALSVTLALTLGFLAARRL